MNQSFVHVDYPTRHQAVARFEGVVDTVKSIRKGFDSTRGLAGVLLAAMVATLVVVADQVMETWVEDGHLLAAWVLLWVVGFAALALLAPAARRLSTRLMTGLDRWSQRVARQRADERLWAMAQSDPRIMADLRMAKTRAESTFSEPVAEKREGGAGQAMRPACYISYM